MFHQRVRIERSRVGRRKLGATVAFVTVASLLPGVQPAAAVSGALGARLAWPVLPIHVSLLPNGRVMSFGTDAAGKQGGTWIYDVWNPALGTGAAAHSVQTNTTGVDLFCAIQSIDNTGRLRIFGGDILQDGWTTNVGNPHVTVFDPVNNTLTKPTASMAFPRWYASSVAMPNGEIVILGGSQPFIDTPEVWNPSTGWRTLTGAKSTALFSKRPDYPHAWVTPNGRIFGVVGDEMFEMTTAGTGTIRSLGFIPPAHWGGSTSVMYAPGKVMLIGGVVDPAAVTLIDINGPAPVVTVGPRLAVGRKAYAQATVLANGQVLVSGGGNNGIFDATAAALPTEVWTPATNTWETGVSVPVPRMYHSSALLLTDGTVLIGGGGAPGPALYMDEQIYTPGYLRGVTRPTFTKSWTSLRIGRSASLTVAASTTVSKVTLVRLGSATHGINLEQRYLELPFTRSGTTVTVRANYSSNVLVPGYYVMSVINSSGVSSVGSIVRIRT